MNANISAKFYLIQLSLVGLKIVLEITHILASHLGGGGLKNA